MTIENAKRKLARYPRPTDENIKMHPSPAALYRQSFPTKRRTVDAAAHKPIKIKSKDISVLENRKYLSGDIFQCCGYN
jgi:hypothetical protein